MFITTDGIVGGAIGSIWMFLLTKFFEIWQKEAEHKNALREAFFQKKLVAAERAVAFWYSTASTLTAISALYEKYSSFAEKASGKTFETLNNQYFAQLEKVRESADQLTNSVFLYFDLESDTSGAKGPLQVLFDVVVVIQDLAISAQALQDVKLTQTVM